MSRRGLRRRASNTVARTTARLARHPMALGFAVLALGAFLAYIAWISVNGPPFQDRYKLDAIVASDSPVLKVGGQVREAGKLAGTITKVSPDGSNLRVSMELRPQFAPVGEDATARVRVRSIVYLTYVEIDPGDRANPMPDGSTIALARTSSGVDLLQVVQLFDRKTRAELRRSLVNTGEGLAGRGTGLNEALADLAPALERGVPELKALTSTPGALAGTIEGAARTSAGLTGTRPDDVDALINSGNAAVGAIADRRVQLGQSIDLLRPFEDEFLATAPLANPLLRDAGGLASELAPPARKLVAGLPQINRLLSLGGPLRVETGRLARLVNPVLKLTGPTLYALYPAVTAIDPLLAALKTTTDTLNPYGGDITRAAEGVISATRVKYPEGQTAPGTQALRFIPVLGCSGGRDPYPAPGESQKESASC